MWVAALPFPVRCLLTYLPPDATSGPKPQPGTHFSRRANHAAAPRRPATNTARRAASACSGRHHRPRRSMGRFGRWRVIFAARVYNRMKFLPDRFKGCGKASAAQSRAPSQIRATLGQGTPDSWITRSKPIFASRNRLKLGSEKSARCCGTAAALSHTSPPTAEAKRAETCKPPSQRTATNSPAWPMTAALTVTTKLTDKGVQSPRAPFLLLSPVAMPRGFFLFSIPVPLRRLPDGLAVLMRP